MNEKETNQVWKLHRFVKECCSDTNVINETELIRLIGEHGIRRLTESGLLKLVERNKKNYGVYTLSGEE